MKSQVFPNTMKLSGCFLAQTLAIILLYQSTAFAYETQGFNTLRKQSLIMESLPAYLTPKPFSDLQHLQFITQIEKNKVQNINGQRFPQIKLNTDQAFTSPVQNIINQGTSPGQVKQEPNQQKIAGKPKIHSTSPFSPSQLSNNSPYSSQTGASSQLKNSPNSKYEAIDVDVLIDNSHLQVHSNAISYQQIENARLWKKFTSQNIFDVNEDEENEIRYYQQKYRIGSFQQIPFCIVVPTYNNAQNERYLRNIRSILMQNYSNYHIVVFDDASTDRTGMLITQFLQSQKKVPKERYRVQRNKEQMKAMYNLRRAAMQFCKPLEIFLVVDGDDELLGKQVLKLFNAYFQKEDAWFVYSNFLMGNVLAVGYSRPFPEKIIQSNTYRYYPFVSSHLRAFYTALFRNINDKDLRGEDGEYYKAANDVAICIPCLQQAHKRVRYLPQLTYFYNGSTGLNNHYVRALEQRSNNRKIRRKPHYKPLQQLVINE